MEFYYAAFSMTHDHITYAAVAAVGTDMATGWVSHLPEPTLQNAVYLFTLIWIIYQLCEKIYSRWKGK